jgi:hypothetical protein
MLARGVMEGGHNGRPFHFTAIEYALLAGGVFLAIVMVVGQVGNALFVTFTSIEAIF